jgi:hypothetical protein
MSESPRPDPVPDELRDLDAALRAARFEPRASFAPELLGRIRRGELPAEPPPRMVPRWGVGAGIAAALALTAASGAWMWQHRAYVTTDRCCSDLDGGTAGDDGVVVRRHPGEPVAQIIVYEDLDHSHSFTPADAIRIVRGPNPLAQAPVLDRSLATTWHCCADYDGDGPDDDGVMVVGVPPDKVMMVALYEQKGKAAPTDGFPLR